MYNECMFKAKGVGAYSLLIEYYGIPEQMFLLYFLSLVNKIVLIGE